MPKPNMLKPKMPKPKMPKPKMPKPKMTKVRGEVAVRVQACAVFVNSQLVREFTAAPPARFEIDGSLFLLNNSKALLLRECCSQPIADDRIPFSATGLP